MGKWLYGEYTTQIDLIENPDLYREVTYRIKTYDVKEPWNEKPDKVDYDVSLWIRLYKSKVDEVECQIKKEHLISEFDDLIQNHLYKIWDMIPFKEIQLIYMKIRSNHES